MYITFLPKTKTPPPHEFLALVSYVTTYTTSFDTHNAPYVKSISAYLRLLLKDSKQKTRIALETTKDDFFYQKSCSCQYVVFILLSYAQDPRGEWKESSVDKYPV